MTVAAFVRGETGKAWAEVKRHVEGGRVFVDGERVTAVDVRVRAGQSVELRLHAPRPRSGPEVRLVHDDAQVVVVDKPSGVSSVPYEERETGTAMDLVRSAWRRQGKAANEVALHVVHRIDKATSGLLMFAKSKRAEIELGGQLRRHECQRAYLCIAQGAVVPGRIESYLVRDRGDGLRGAARHAGQGKRAVTYVAAVETLRGATLCAVRLETGKTHQIRIHLSERGNPLVGEDVYVRDLLRDGGTPLRAPRLMLHAATLGFMHPSRGGLLRFTSPRPADFLAAVRQLGGRGDGDAYLAAAVAMAAQTPAPRGDGGGDDEEDDREE